MYEGAPDYPDKDVWWEIDRALRGDDLLHGADGDPRLHEVGRGVPRGRTTSSSLRLLGSVGEPINPKAWLWYHKVIGGGALSDRRHLVADRDRPHHDLAAAGDHRDQARLGDAAAAGDRRRGLRRGTASRSRRARGCSSCAAPGRACCAPSTARRSASSRPTSRRFGPRDLPGRRRRAPRRGRLLLGAGPDRRRGQRLRPPPLDRGGRVGDRLPPEGRRGGGDRPDRRGHGPGDLRLRHPRGRPRGRRRDGRRAAPSTSPRGSANWRGRSG